MTLLAEFQQYIKTSQVVRKTRLTWCSYKRGAVKVTEQRLWVWFIEDERPWLVKETELTRDHREDFRKIFKEWMRL